MKLYSTRGTRKNADNRRDRQTGTIILACITITLGLALAVILISVAVRANRTEPEQDSLQHDAEPILSAPSSADAFDRPENGAEYTEDSPDVSVTKSDAAPAGSGAETGKADISAGQGVFPATSTEKAPETTPVSGGSSVDKNDDAGQTAESPGSAGEMPETPDGSGEKTGERIEIDDSALRQNAENVYYYVYYFESGDYSTGGDSEKTPSASVIKVFIMEYIFLKNAEGTLNLEEKLNGNTILSLLTDMIRRSDNDATNTLIDRFGMDTLNSFFIEQGYSDTVLERKMLDYTRRSAGFENYTSLVDCMNFLEKLYTAREEEPYRRMLEIMEGQQVRTKIPLKLPSGVIIANKTGELDSVESDIGIVFAENSPFAIVILTNNVKNSAGMRNAIADFALAAYENA